MAAVKVTGITATITEGQIRDFFSYSGEVTSVELFDEALGGRSAIVRFAEEAALETALLLSGATIVSGDPPVTVTAVDSAQLAAVAAPVSIAAGAPALGELSSGQVPPPAGSASEVVERAQRMVKLLAERGYVLGVDALAKAKEIDEKHGLTLKAKEVSEQLRLKERVEAAAEAAKPVGAMAKQFATEGAVKARETALHAVDRAKELNEKYQLAEKSKEAASAAVAKAKELNEQYKVTETAKSAVSSVMQNEKVQQTVSIAKQGVLSGLSWAGAKAESLMASRGGGSGAPAAQ